MQLLGKHTIGTEQFISIKMGWATQFISICHCCCICVLEMLSWKSSSRDDRRSWAGEKCFWSHINFYIILYVLSVFVFGIANVQNFQNRFIFCPKWSTEAMKKWFAYLHINQNEYHIHHIVSCVLLPCHTHTHTHGLGLFPVEYAYTLE